MADQHADSFMPPRRLRVLAFDPGTGNKFLNRSIREVTITLPWEFDPSDPNAPFWGPRGEYLEVIDYDPASGAFYEPINLNDKQVLLSDGVSPSEEDPRFHQQMVYAVAMETIAIFEQALGRRVLWAPRWEKLPSGWQDTYVQRLRIYPHALREANAYYDPRKKALLFGYFTAGAESRSAPPGTTVFTCLSHDIIVHETVHAILDGMHPRFAEASHPDMLALHEAFSDIVAIFQQFSHAEILEDQIARTRGDLDRQSLLGELAQEFGEAIGRGGALRSALGSFIDGVWTPREPDHRAMENAKGPHARGAILVAAVFRAFLTIYRSRTKDLFRIASGGSGILRDGAIDPDLVKRLSNEAAQASSHVLQICIRAMDYVPPVSVSFGDFLRAIITADHDLFPEDPKGYRRAFIEAFTSWGIRPEGMPVVTEAALLWPSLTDAAKDAGFKEGTLLPFQKQLRETAYWTSRPREAVEMIAATGKFPDHFIETLQETLLSLGRNYVEKVEKRYLTADRQGMEPHANGQMSGNIAISLSELDLNVDREFLQQSSRAYGLLFWTLLTFWPREILELVGISCGDYPQKTVRHSDITGRPRIHVYSVRMARRAGQRGQTENEYVVELIQSRDGYRDPDKQAGVDKHGIPDLVLHEAGEGYVDAAGEVKVPFDPEKHQIEDRNGRLHPRPKIPDPEYRHDFRYRAGCTLLIDARTFRIRRIIRTPFRAEDDRGLAEMRTYLRAASRQAMNAFDGPDGTGDTSRAFAMLHRHVGGGH
ncbi:MAG: hypothetical protein AAF409_11035 [Pseudomonadota bacterium]